MTPTIPTMFRAAVDDVADKVWLLAGDDELTYGGALARPFDDPFLSLIALRRLVSFGRALAAGAHILLMCRFVLLCAFARAVARVDLCVNVARLNIASRFAGRSMQHNEIQLRLFHLLVSIYRLFLQRRRLPERECSRAQGSGATSGERPPGRRNPPVRAGARRRAPRSSRPPPCVRPPSGHSRR